MDYAVILAGGKGSRFWPLSREACPKQFLKIIGKDTLLRSTIKRIRKIIPDKNIFIITPRLYLAQVKKNLKNFNIPAENIILEPKPLNTLPAISLCAQLINLKDKDANLLVLPSDHYIENNSGFRKTIFKALRLSTRGFLCLVGVKPDGPRLGLGYIIIGRKIGRDMFFVDSFQEKPSLNTARKLLGKRGAFWNSGIFCFKAETLLNELKTWVPELYLKISSIKTKKDIARSCHKIKPISIDYGLLEKSDNLAMVKSAFSWQDLGSWIAISNILPKDKKNNTLFSDCVHLDTQNTFIYSKYPKRFIATIGVEGLLVVDTLDALLVCKKERSEEIKRLVELLKKKRRTCV